MWTVLLASIIGVAIILAIMQWAIYSKTLPGIVDFDQTPFLGHWVSVARNLDRLYDWKLSQAERADAMGREIVQRTAPMLAIVEIHSPRMLQYMLKDNFDNFEKGSHFRGIFAEFLGGGIFNVDGEQWRTQRKIASHMFSAAKLNNCMLQSFLAHSVTLMDMLELHQKKQQGAAGGADQYVDLQSLFYRFTMDSIMRIGFGVQLDSLKCSTPPAFVEAFDTLQESIVMRFLGPPLKYKIARMLGLGKNERAIARCIPVVDEFVYGIVRARKAQAEEYKDSGDLLSLFIADAAKHAQAQAQGGRKRSKGGEENDGEADGGSASGASGAVVPAESAGLSDQELRDIVLNFMIAGRDTTASLLTFLFYELSLHPDVESKVLEEVRDVFGELTAEESRNSEACVRNISHDTLRRAVYMEATILETLRLHPPVPAENKRAVADCTFPDGSRVPAGRLVAWAPYVFGRLKSIWGEDALSFRPERFLSEPDENGVRSVVQPSPFVHPAFNAGFRLCLGKSMAIMEAKTATAALLRRFKLRVKPDHSAQYRLTIVLSMKHGLPVSVHDRAERVIFFDLQTDLQLLEFVPLIDRLLGYTPSTRQILCFSATFPITVKDFAQRWLQQVHEINLMEELTLKGITQFYAFVEEKQKVQCINTLFTKLNINQAIIFANSVNRVELLAKKITEIGTSWYDEGCTQASARQFYNS